MEVLYKYNDSIEDINNVIGFTKNLPVFVDNFIKQEYSNISEYLEGFPKDISYEKLQVIYQETKDTFKTSFDLKIKLDDLLDDKRLIVDGVYNSLENCGLTKQSLKFKLDLLNSSWEKILESIEKTTNKILDFSNKDMMKLVLKFLGILSSACGSLSIVFPFLEPIKELLDIINYFAS